MVDLFSVSGRFIPSGRIRDVREFGNGNINDTFLVAVEGGEEEHFILQRINREVFRRPELIMRNMRTCTEHIIKRLKLAPLREGRRWAVPVPIVARDGRDYWVGEEGDFWRAVSFIERARSFETIRDGDHALETGCALGVFHNLLSDMEPGELADTLEGFHITPLYMSHYDKALARYAAAPSLEVKYCLRFVEERRRWSHVLEDARRRGMLFDRAIHGDPKVNNILIDDATGRAVSIIDLDTVKSGLVHYDIGDCLRSGCNLLGEETEEWESVRFDSDICRYILPGYLGEAREFLTESDFSLIYDSIRLIAFELGLRFFTDYLEGNIYFRIRRPEHNLARSLVQFRLTESIESQEDTIKKIIRDFR